MSKNESLQWSKSDLRLLRQAIIDAGDEGLKIYYGGHEDVNEDWFNILIVEWLNEDDDDLRIACIKVSRSNLWANDYLSKPIFEYLDSTYHTININLWSEEHGWTDEARDSGVRFSEEPDLDLLDSIFTEQEKESIRISLDMD